ncbi:EF hand domain-containing protein [Novosphingobium sp. PhB165]|uniref:EF-hand domain-containing protein n=1 Tax=Novosphingobium sp. PhB165 TaxID=2485105 RepID=UPI00104C6EFB|nr:EF-hand domain-containing protein [Novosphingobium sp. PhB165]TCM16993.1 EF hand domain-containing protein [Novosphingobium sp. PhB165]
MTNRLTKLAIGLSAAALTISGVAVAQTPQSAGRPGHDFKADANGDGTVTRAEAQAAAEAAFARLDVNKDGKIDQADRDARRAQMREEQFKRLDTNGDGSISKAEFMADRGPGNGAPGNWGPGKRGPGDHGGRGPGGDRGPGGFGGRGDMAGMAGANKDGSVTKAEFVAAAMNRFDKMDTNKDGQVTREERQAARQQMRAQHPDWHRGGNRPAPSAPAPATTPGN